MVLFRKLDASIFDMWLLFTNGTGDPDGGEIIHHKNGKYEAIEYRPVFSPEQIRQKKEQEALKLKEEKDKQAALERKINYCLLATFVIFSALVATYFMAFRNAE